jgi:RHS repeat-associated protein
MTSIPIPANLASAYAGTYDAWNRLVSLANGSTTVATYAYDGLNRRIVKGTYVSGALDHNEHAYFNENWQTLEVRKEVSGTINSNPLEQYVWHPFYIDAPVLRDYDQSLSGTPTRYYHAFDTTFSTTALATAGGAVTERYLYTSYGAATFLNSSFTLLTPQQSQVANPITYTGCYSDTASGLYSVRFRNYHGQLGVFCTRDPAGLDGREPSLYRYTMANPTNLTDPMGLGRSCVFILAGSGGDDQGPKYHQPGQPLPPDTGNFIRGPLDNPADIPALIRAGKCCDIAIVGHRGSSDGKTPPPWGMIIYPTGDHSKGILMFGLDDNLPEQIAGALDDNGCREKGDGNCSINLYPCQYLGPNSDFPYQTLQAVTGCQVYVPTGKPDLGNETIGDTPFVPQPKPTYKPYNPDGPVDSLPTRKPLPPIPMRPINW